MNLLECHNHIKSKVNEPNCTPRLAQVWRWLLVRDQMQTYNDIPPTGLGMIFDLTATESRYLHETIQAYRKELPSGHTGL